MRATHVNRKGNNNGSTDVISAGSRILVPPKTAAILVDNGNVVQVCDEGTYEWKDSSSGSVLGKSKVGSILGDAWDRFRFAGEVAKYQRIYYINLMEIRDARCKNEFKLPYLDEEYGNVYLEFRIVFSFVIVDPELFYKNITGDGNCTTEDLIGTFENPKQMVTEVEDITSQEISKLSKEGVKYAYLMSHRSELDNKIIEAINKKWHEKRGIELFSLTLMINGDATTRKRIETYDQAKIFSEDPGALSSQYILAVTEAQKTAAGNSAGAMTGMAGLGMATQSATTQAAFDMLGKSSLAEAQEIAAAASRLPSDNLENIEQPDYVPPTPEKVPTQQPQVTRPESHKFEIPTPQKTFTSSSNPNIIVKKEKCPNCKYIPAEGVFKGKFCENCGQPINRWWEKK